MRRLIAFLIIMALLSPIFGVWLADMVGYHEPLDVAVEALNKTAHKIYDLTKRINWTPFVDYTVPGLPDWAGYIVCALMGLAIYLALLALIRRVRKEGRIK